MHRLRAERMRDGALMALATLLMIVAFALLPVPGGIDWETFVGAAQRVWTGRPLYGELVSAHSYFYNPPWLAVLLTPVGLLPFQLGLAVLSAVTLLVTLLVMRRWQAGKIRTILALLSPPMIFTVLHGEIDGLVLGGVLLPQEWWALVALTKPQVAVSLILGIPRQKWLAAAAVTAAVFLASVLWFGNWPLQLITQPMPLTGQTWNLWGGGLWPFQVPAGVALILLGMARHDERLLLTAPPFLAPYATTSSMLGPWMAVSTFLAEWQAAVVWASWWGAVIYRALL